MKKPPLPELSSKQWAILLCALFVIFVAGLVYSFLRVMTITEIEVRQSVASAAPAARATGEADTVGVGQSAANHYGGKKLPLQPAPTHPELAQQVELFLPKEEAHARAIRDQGNYLRQQSTKYKDSPLNISQEEIDKMEKEGRMAW